MTVHPVYGAPCPAPGYHGWLDEMQGNHRPTPEREYHTWSGMSGSFIANEEHWRSPMHLQAALNAEPIVPTEPMRLGSAMHNLIATFGDAEASYVVAPDCDRRSKANKGRHADAQIEADAQGLPLIAPAKVSVAHGMYEAVQANDDAMNLLSGPIGLRAHGMTEAAMTWRENGVLCKGRADRICVEEPQEDVILVDVKSTKNASPKAFARSIFDYGYHIQLAHYRSGIVRTPVDFDEWPERIAEHYRDGFPMVPTHSCVRCAIVAVENTPPYGCSVVWLNDEWLQLGDTERLRRLAMLNRATHRDEWPGYPRSYESEPPRWALPREDQLTSVIREVARAV